MLKLQIKLLGRESFKEDFEVGLDRLLCLLGLLDLKIVGSRVSWMHVCICRGLSAVYMRRWIDGEVTYWNPSVDLSSSIFGVSLPTNPKSAS